MSNGTPGDTASIMLTDFMPSALRIVSRVGDASLQYAAKT
jgi:hypothetical protein